MARPTSAPRPADVMPADEVLPAIAEAMRETLLARLGLRSSVPDGAPDASTVYELTVAVPLARGGASGVLVLSADLATARALASRLAGRNLEEGAPEVALGLTALGEAVALEAMSRLGTADEAPAEQGGRALLQTELGVVGLHAHLQHDGPG